MTKYLCESETTKLQNALRKSDSCFIPSSGWSFFAVIIQQNSFGKKIVMREGQKQEEWYKRETAPRRLVNENKLNIYSRYERVGLLPLWRGNAIENRLKINEIASEHFIYAAESACRSVWESRKSNS